MNDEGAQIQKSPSALLGHPGGLGYHPKPSEEQEFQPRT
jgi:hypothetical protein